MVLLMLVKFTLVSWKPKSDIEILSVQDMVISLVTVHSTLSHVMELGTVLISSISLKIYSLITIPIMMVKSILETKSKNPT